MAEVAATLEREIKEAKTKDRFSPNRIEKVLNFMKFCQANLSDKEYTKSTVLREYCEKHNLSIATYLNCMVSMGWVERKGERRGATYRWKANINDIQPIHARRLITCVNEVVDKYRVVINSQEEKTEEPVAVVQTTQTVVMNEPVITEKVVKERKPKQVEQKTVETQEVSYFWGLFRRTIKKETL